MTLLRKFWSLIAVVVGAVLVAFEVRRGGGVNFDNGFWVVVGGLIVVLGLLNLFTRRGPDEPAQPPDPTDLGLRG